MQEFVLYQTVLQKLGQLSPNDLIQLHGVPIKIDGNYSAQANHSRELR